MRRDSSRVAAPRGLRPFPRSLRAALAERRRAGRTHRERETPSQHKVASVWRPPARRRLDGESARMLLQSDWQWALERGFRAGRRDPCGASGSRRVPWLGVG
jgi:hypothetical protein